MLESLVFLMDYKEALDYLYGLQHHGIKLGLSNILSLMDILRGPHQAFKSIHIAGTNGKGSTAAMISFILQAAGLRVGLYTSPHLVSFTERIKVNGVPIPEERVIDLVMTLKSKLPTLNSLSPTFFEFTTALAFQYLKEEEIDIAVIEVGMGGRLDATNVIIPMVSAITNIGYDHQEFLGNTLSEIAREKAGIIKEGVPVITADQERDALKVIEDVSKENGAKLYIYGEDFRADPRLQTQVFDYYGLEYILRALELSLLGSHQIVNASLAIATCEVLNPRIEIDEEAIRKGLKETIWEGRLEVALENPTILLDGAHNENAARCLKRALKEIFLHEHDRLFLIIGIMKDKDIRGILKALAPLAHEVIVTRPDSERAAPASLLLSEAERFNPRVKVIERVSDALMAAKEKASSSDLICVTGSLYTVGEARLKIAEGIT